MPIDDSTNSQDSEIADVKGHSKEIVMGLQWDAPIDGDPDDLDALCVLLDEKRRVLEVIHPGYPRNTNASVLHTGDSRTGASTWDDERIFVFLEALPQVVSALTFVVVSVTGRFFGEIPGASCHVSDRVTEGEHVRLDLTALEARMAHCIATLYRSPTGWRISTDIEVRVGLISSL